VRQRIVLISAANQTNRRIFAHLRPMLASKVAVKVHLPNVGVSKRPDFQVDQDEATQPTMEEHQVHSKPFMADPQPLLPPNEGKLVAEFEQEAFEMSNQRLLQFAFRVFILLTVMETLTLRQTPTATGPARLARKRFDPTQLFAQRDRLPWFWTVNFARTQTERIQILLSVLPAASQVRRAAFGQTD
jgi:hypothetical protein